MINTEVAYIMTTLGDLELASGGKTLQMFTPKNTPLGLLKVHGVDIKKLPTFSDYLQSGYQISLIGAIDFTFSNGSPSNPTSLHCDGENNQYAKILKSVTDVLCKYDSDQKYPFYGFGGIPEFMGSNQVSYCFPLNGNTANPEIVG